MGTGVGGREAMVVPNRLRLVIGGGNSHSIMAGSAGQRHSVRAGEERETVGC